MQALKRELLLCLTISALVFTSALAWGSPFTTFASAAQAVAVSSNAQQQQQTPNDSQDQGQMQQQQQSPTTFTGTVVKSGSSYVLEDSSGHTYKLSAGSGASKYVGKTVTVSGQLDPQSKTIQVSNIQPS